jgi:hypothetical protein
MIRSAPHRDHAFVIGLVMLMCGVASASAQDQAHRSLVLVVVKQVFLDPTTYAPAIVAWTATRLDWQTSQVFFQNGSTEHNARFTTSGLGDDTAMSYGAGNRQILTDAFANMQYSLVNNASSRVVEGLLIPRYPNHRTLFRTVGWIERSVMASYLSYGLSAGHFRQWQENGRRAQQLGY